MLCILDHNKEIWKVRYNKKQKKSCIKMYTLVRNNLTNNIKAVYCHPAHLTSMQSTSWETLGWMKHKLESRLLREISITSDMQMTPPLWQKVKKN